MNRSKPRAAKHRGSVRYFHSPRRRWRQHRSKFHRGRRSGRSGGISGDHPIHICKQEFQDRMSRAKGGFTVELKRPKRHLLNRSAAPKASWITEGDLLPAKPRADTGTRAGASSDHDARAMAERLFAPRTAQQPRILPTLTQEPDPYGSLEDVLPPETHGITAAFVDAEDEAVPSDSVSAESDETEDAVVFSGAPMEIEVRRSRRMVRLAAGTDLPAGKRWMRLLPSVVQERAVPRWKKMQSARIASRACQRRDQTSDDSH
ncbi:hypothetical protein C8J34_12618 [Rhizobium sp. PP-F2F-G36]|nr:hypothetical protein C8J34_12618 [Rhizobium sp. PP-F2F-G36]